VLYALKKLQCAGVDAPIFYINKMSGIDDHRLAREMRNDPNFRGLEIVLKQYIRESIDELKKEQQQLLEGNEPLLTIEDISKKFKVTKATIHNWMNKGSIVGKKFGKNRYFSLKEVKASLEKYNYDKLWEGRTEF
jgi:hypothetical protein